MEEMEKQVNKQHSMHRINGKVRKFGKFRRKLTRFFVLAFKSITMYNTLYIKCLSLGIFNS